MSNVTLHIDGNETVIIANKNTTIGYATFDASNGELTYIFVSSQFRRCGYGTMLLATVNKVAGYKLKPAGPISALGQKFFTNVGEKNT